MSWRGTFQAGELSLAATGAKLETFAYLSKSYKEVLEILITSSFTFSYNVFLPLLLALIQNYKFVTLDGTNLQTELREKFMRFATYNASLLALYV